MADADPSLRTRGAFVVAAWVTFSAATYAWAGGYMVDDAFIVFRVAERVAAGEPWAFRGPLPTDGVTAPLWGALLVLAARVGDTPSVARVVGCVFTLAGGALTLLTVVDASARRGGAFRRSPSLAAAFLGVQLPLLVWAGAGLETGLATLAVALATRGLWTGIAPAPGPHGSGWRVSSWVALAAVPWLRPELVPLAMVAAWFRCADGPSARSRARSLLALGLGTVSVVVMRVRVFGHPLPLAVLAKPSDPLLGARYVLLTLFASGALTALSLVLLAHLRARGPAGLLRGLRSFGPRPVRLALGVGLGSVLLSGGDWMPAGRLLVPLLPLLAGSVGMALASLPCRPPGSEVEGTPLAERPRPRRVPGWVVPAALVLALPAAVTLAALPGLRAQPEARERGARDVLRALEGASCVALVDIGYLAYRGGFDVVDLGGVTDLEIARLPGGHLEKRIPEALLRVRGVDAIVLHSSSPPRVGARGSANAGRLLGLAGYPVELQVARMPFVQSEFRVEALVEYAPDYHYVVLRRAHGAPRSGGADRR